MPKQLNEHIHIRTQQSNKTHRQTSKEKETITDTYQSDIHTSAHTLARIQKRNIQNDYM